MSSDYGVDPSGRVDVNVCAVPNVCVDRNTREALDALRFKDVRSTTFERLRVTWEADAQVQGLPQPLQLGKGLRYLLEHVPVPVAPHDLILGRMPERVPDKEEEAFYQGCLAQWDGRAIPSWMRDGGHECFAWDRLLCLGLPGLQSFAQGQLDERLVRGEQGAHLDYLRGAIRVYQAFRLYARRYAEAAYGAGLLEAGDRCARLAEGPPRNFAEALQLIWLVGVVYCTMLSQNPTLTFGRMDALLLPYYERDLAEGGLTRERAGDLVTDFYCKNNLVLGRGEHQMGHGSGKDTGWTRNLTYDAPQYVVLGGTRVDGSSVANDLTALFLERIVPRFENPVVVLRYTPDLPDAMWRLACAKMRDNASMMIYNDRSVIPAMVHAGVAPEDAATYTMHGCNWPDVPGIEHSVSTRFLLLPQRLLEAIESVAVTAGDKGQRTSAGLMDALYDRFRMSVRAEVETFTDWLRENRAAWGDRAPGLLRVEDCFFDGPVECARSWQVGGVRYTPGILAISGIASVADALAALEQTLLSSGQASLQVLLEALDDNWRGHEALRRRCLNASKFGQDDECADRHAVRALNIVLDEVDRATRLGAENATMLFCCLETDMRHIHLGRELGATPDGRRAGEPISENTSPNPGACINGLTAMLRSVAQLPLDRIHSGALNVRMRPRWFVGEEGLTRLASVLRAYFDLGGLQVQLSFADVETLRDAQQHPERHRDLMVRITGYSAAFVDMTRKAQDEIIRREEMGG
jgi:formate C-acetyltransferase